MAGVRYHLEKVLKAEGLPSYVREEGHGYYTIFVDKVPSLTPKGDALAAASKVCEGMNRRRFDSVQIADVAESNGDYHVTLKVG